MLDGGMLQSREGKNKVPASVCVCVHERAKERAIEKERERERERVITCEVLGAALCSLKGSGCCPAPCSLSTVLHVSHPLSFAPHPFLSCSSLLPLAVYSSPFSALHPPLPGLLQQNAALQRCC